MVYRDMMNACNFNWKSNAYKHDIRYIEICTVCMYVSMYPWVYGITPVSEWMKEGGMEKATNDWITE